MSRQKGGLLTFNIEPTGFSTAFSDEDMADPKDLAYMLSSEAVRGCCMSDVSMLVRLGRRRDAERYISCIVKALNSVRCAMTEHVPSCCSDLPDWFLQCMRRGDILGGFEC